MNNIEQLHDFIKRAERNYKYKPNTAAALGGGVKLFGTVLTDEEVAQSSFPIDKLDEITERIHVKFGDRYSVDSLETYKSRMKRVVNDYAKYGADAKSMASWNPLAKQRKRAAKSNGGKTATAAEPNGAPINPVASLVNDSDPKPVELPGLQDIRLPLADNRSVVIYYPMDLSETEAEKIGTVLKGIAALSKIE